MLHGSRVLGLCGVDRLSSGRSRGQGQHLQIAGQKAEAARPSVGIHCAAGIARPRGVADNRDLDSVQSSRWLAGLRARRTCVLIGIWCFTQKGLDRAPPELL